MSAAIETLHPDVYVIEQGGQPRIQGVSANVAGFIGMAEKGPIDRAVYVTSLDQFERTFGGRYEGSYLFDAVRHYFNNGGQTCWVCRATPLDGTAVPAEVDVVDHAQIANAATILGSRTAPFNMDPGDTLTLTVDADPGAPRVVTFTASPATLTGAGATVFPLAGTIYVEVNNSGELQPVVLNILAGPTAFASLLSALNTGVRGIQASETAPGSGILLITSDTRGTDGALSVTGAAPLLAALWGGVPAYVPGASPSSLIADIDNMTVGEVVAYLNDATVGLKQAGWRTATAINVGGAVRITSDNSSGFPSLASTSILIAGGPNPVASILGFTLGATTNGTLTGTENILQVKAINPGKWGNNLSVTIGRWATTLATATNIGLQPRRIQVVSVAGMALGDVVKIYGAGGTVFTGVIYDIDPANRYLFLHSGNNASPGLNTDYAAGSMVTCSTSHRFASKTVAAVASGASSFTVGSASTAVVGQRVILVGADGVNFAEGQIQSIAGDVITLSDPVSFISGNIPAGSTVVSLEFDISVYEKGNLAETIQFLSMNGLDSTPPPALIPLDIINYKDYVGIRLAGDTNESLYIEIVPAALPTATPKWQWVPAYVSKAALTSGSDGTPLTGSDYIGSQTSPKSGLYLLDPVVEVNFIAIPGQTDVAVHSAMVTWCENRGDVDAILDPDPNFTTVEEMYNYRQFTIPFDSSHASIYWPWLVEADPYNSGRLTPQPPSGYAAGAWANIGALRGVHVPPANVVVFDAVDVAVVVGDGDQDLLNPVGVNCIRRFPGEGIRIWGCRTMFSVQDGRHYINVRRLLNFVKSSVKRGNRWAVMSLNDPDLWDTIERVNREFLNSLWLRGQLYPTNDSSRAYFVMCNAQNNPDSERKAGRVFCDIGINPPLPAEFVIFRVGLWDGGTSISEEIARRG